MDYQEVARLVERYGLGTCVCEVLRPDDIEKGVLRKLWRNACEALLSINSLLEPYYGQQDDDDACSSDVERVANRISISARDAEPDMRGM